MPPSSPLVAHLCWDYLPSTETFIYNYLSNFRESTPVVVSYAPASNLDRFPFPVERLFSLSPTGLSGTRLFWAARRYLGGSGPSDEEFRRRALKRLRSLRPQVLHAHFGSMALWALPVVRQLGLPLVCSFYGVDTAPDPNHPAWPQAMRQLFAQGNLFLALGPRMRQRLIDLGCPPHKVEIQPVALAFDRLPMPAPAAPREPPVLLFSGRMVEKKGLCYVLEAVRILRDRGSANFKLRIIGDGPLAAALRASVEREKLGSIVRFLGPLSHAAYLEELGRADLFLHPSVTAADGDTEGTPTSILEAQALGRPVISTWHADIPNCTLPGESALLLAERDTNGMVQAIQELLADPERRSQMGRAGRRFVEQHHNVSRAAAQLEERYRKLVDSPAAFA